MITQMVNRLDIIHAKYYVNIVIESDSVNMTVKLACSSKHHASTAYVLRGGY